MALARALAVEPTVLLLDEPFGALDSRVRKDLRRWLRQLHDELHITSIFVTHDQEEALELADRVVVMNQGRIEQVGTPEQVYNRPASKFVGGFIGSPMMNFLDCTVDRAAPAILLADGIRMPIDAARLPKDGGQFTVGIRPEHFSLADASHAAFAARADVVEPLGSDTLVFMRVGDADVVARLPPSLRIAAGDRLELAVDTAAIHFFDPASGKAVR